MVDEMTPRPPVFVVGASRSGTALIRSALNRSSSIFLAGETHYFDDLRPRLGAQDVDRLDDRRREECENYFLALSHRPYGHGGDPLHARIDRAELRREAALRGGSGDAYFESYCRLARSLEQDAAAAPVRWGEKTPRHVFRLDEMLTRYPGAQVIAMYRDPRGVVASYGNWHHQGGFDLAADAGHAQALEEEEERARASFDPGVISLLWRATVSAGHAARQRYGASRVRLLRYEDLVADPGGTLVDVMAWLGLEYETGMVDVPMHNSSFSSFRAGSGVSSEPVDRWRTTLAPRDVAIVQLWCRRGLTDLGYPLDPAQIGGTARIRALTSLPTAAGRAVWVNRSRAGRLPTYVWRRLRLMRRR